MNTAAAAATTAEIDAMIDEHEKTCKRDPETCGEHDLLFSLRADSHEEPDRRAQLAARISAGLGIMNPDLIAEGVDTVETARRHGYERVTLTHGDHVMVISTS